MSAIPMILAIVIGIAAIMFLVIPMFKGIAWLIANIFKGVGTIIMHLVRYVVGTIGDTVRFVGAIITGLVFVPLILGSVVIGRWSKASHFGKALQDEIKTGAHCLYRVAIGHPMRLLLMHGLVEGIEQRIPDAMAQSPGADKPSRRTGQFDGYTIVGSLAGGGSGGRLFIAEPDDKKRAAFARNGQFADQVVIKSFSLQDGSSLPQIIRESRALESAKKLGLVLDHELNDERFYYAMPYVPGDNLTVVTKRLHAESGPRGLEAKQLAGVMNHMAGLLKTLSVYHHGGLWHKDIKPDNIIISGGEAHVVDLGLVTPLRSAMTLTTHGTEYFRDPEMVRMALRGAKVKDVDGAKFDLYGAGAVLYAVLENNFPAHGGLSQFTKKSPEALRWIARRSMTDMNKRYASADEMLADLRVVMEASDPYSVKPASLPSVMGGHEGAEAVAQAVAEAAAAAQAQQDAFSFPVDPVVQKAASPVPPREGVGPVREGTAQAARDDAKASPRKQPKIKVTDWFTGRYASAGEQDFADQPRQRQNPKVYVAGFGANIRAHTDKIHEIVDQVREHVDEVRGVRRGTGAPVRHAEARVPVGSRRSAAEQLKNARGRAQAARKRVQKRMRHSPNRYKSGPNAGVFVAMAFMFLFVFGAIKIVKELSEHAGGIPSLVENARNKLDGLTVNLGDKAITFNFADDEAPGTMHDIDALNDLGEHYADTGAWGDVGEFFRVHDLETISQDEYELSELGHAVQRARQLAFAYAPPGPGEWALDMSTVQPLGSILVLNRLPDDLAKANSAKVEAMVTKFIRGRFDVRGLGLGERDIELVAQAETEAGMAQPDDHEAIARLERWMAREDCDIDAVLWLAPGDDRQWTNPRLVVCPQFDEKVILRTLSQD